MTIGKNVSLSKDTELGEGVVIGNNVTIYPKVTIGPGTTIFDNAVIGRQPMSTGNTTRPVDDSFRTLTIGRNSIIGACSVLYTGITIGSGVLIGDLARIREGCKFEDQVVIGGGVLVMYDTLIGKRTRVIDGSIITGNMIIEEDVFIGPGMNSINDNSVYLARFGLEHLLNRGPIIRRLALIGAGSNLAAGIEIGEGAIVAPNAMVTTSVEPWTMYAGIPAKKKYDVDPEMRKKILQHVANNNK